MGAGAWQHGAERKLGEREKPIPHRSLLNFPSTKVKEKRRKKRAMLVYVKEAERKRKLEALVLIACCCCFSWGFPSLLGMIDSVCLVN